MNRTSESHSLTGSFFVGRASLPHASAYSISKFGVEAFSDALRRELSPSGVKVSVIEPGFFRTNITNKDNLRWQWEGLWDELDDSLKEEYGHDFYQTSKDRDSLIAVFELFSLLQ